MRVANAPPPKPVLNRTYVLVAGTPLSRQKCAKYLRLHAAGTTLIARVFSPPPDSALLRPLRIDESLE